MPKKEIDIRWQCLACQFVNPIRIPRPGYYSAVILKCSCEQCDSDFEIKFLRYKAGQVSFEFLSTNFSSKGLEVIEERNKKQQAEKAKTEREGNGNNTSNPNG